MYIQVKLNSFKINISGRSNNSSYMGYLFVNVQGLSLLYGAGDNLKTKWPASD